MDQQTLDALVAKHSWMPLQATLGLADSGTTTNDAMTTAEALRQTVSPQDDGFHSYFDDPVLHKKSSLGLALTQYLSQAVGPWPIAESDLTKMQHALQKAGYGKELDPTGVWSPGWEAARQQHLENYREHQYQKGGDSGFSFDSVMNAMGALNLTDAGDAIIGFVKSIPGQARQLMGDVVGGLGGTAFGALEGLNSANLEGFQRSYREGMFRGMAGVTGALGKDTSAQQEAAEWGINYKTMGFSENGPLIMGGHFVGDVGMIFLLTGLIGSGSRFATALGAERAAAGNAAAQEALTLSSAYRGPGVVARSIGGSTVVDETGATVVRGGLAGTRAFQNLPILQRVGPWLEKAADADAWYYRTRGSMSAALYRNPAARLGGQAVSDISIQGAKIRGVAAASQLGGQDTPLSEGVQNEHLLDSVDAAIKTRLGVTILGQHIAPSINDLLFVLHPAHGAASAGVGRSANEVLDSTHDALQEITFTGALQRATGKSLKELEDEMGGAAQFTQFYTNKFADMAASFGAEYLNKMELDRAGEIRGKLDWERDYEALRTLEHNIRNDPELLDASIKGLRASFGNEEVVGRLMREIAHSRVHGFESLGGKNFMEASGIVNRELLPYVEGIPQAEGKPLKVLLNAGTRRGGLGLAQSTTLTRQDAFRILGQLRKERLEIQARMEAAPGGIAEADSGVLGPMGEELSAAGTPVATLEPVTAREVFAWQAKMGDFLRKELGIDARAMPQDDFEMLDRAKQMANRLSTEVTLDENAPESVVAAFDRLNEMGYKVVSGTDIGHVHIGPNPLVELGGEISWKRKVAEALSLSPELVANSDIASHRYAGTLHKIQDAIDKGRIKLPPYMDAGTLMALARREGFIDTTSRLKSAIAHLTGAAGPDAVATKVAELRSETTGLTEAQLERAAVAQVEAEISGVMMPADIPRKKFVAAFMNPEKYREAVPASGMRRDIDAQLRATVNITDTEGNPLDLPNRLSEKEALRASEAGGALDRKSAEALYDAFRRGATTPGWYQMGASKIDWLFRSSMGFAGNGVYGRAAAGALAGGAVGLASDPDKAFQGDLSNVVVGGTAGALLAASGGDNLGWAVANMPNRLKQIAQNTRFTMSPYFSARRVAKSNAKMALEGVPVTLRPLSAMQRAGTEEFDKGVLRRIYPSLVNDVADDADRYLQQQDIFGLYNHRNYEAYAAGHWAREGLSDAEIKKKLIRVFEYGRDGTVGRSQLERSSNFLFFPFSFDKTLYRNFGAYMLDNPAQRIVLTRGLAAYDQFNKEHANNPLSTNWLRKHIPLLEEAAHLNAFAHGISPGEFGGINRPLLNIFLPQAWSSSEDNLATLKRFVPAIKDFSRITAELQEQGSITQRAGENMWKDLQGIPATYADPRVSTEDSYSQLDSAFALQRSWYEKWQGVLTANEKTTDPDRKARFPMEARWGRWAGEPISKAAIKDMIQARYPAYDPARAVDYAVENNRNLQNYLLDNKGTVYGEYARTFVEQTKKLGSALARDSVSTEAAARYTAGLREAAVWLANHDSTFYRLYDHSFKKTLGPLEAI